MLSSRYILVPALLAAGLAATALPALATDAEDDLGALVERSLRDGGPFFTPEEQAVINRACGYSAGEWDGYEISMHGDVLHCTNGRTVDDPQVRRVMRQAAPRIGRRVQAVMARPEVRDTIARIAEEASARAMAALARHEE